MQPSAPVYHRNAYVSIIDNYLAHLSPRKTYSEKNWFVRQVNLRWDGLINTWYSWRNWFTGEYYSGESVPFFLFSILGIKTEHAEFIAVIDCIAKLDPHAEIIIQEIATAQNNEDLF